MLFRQTRALRHYEPGTRNVSHVELVNESFQGEGLTKDPDKADIYYELRNGIKGLPSLCDDQTIDPSGYVEDVIRLMNPKLMMNPAISIRCWPIEFGHFMGYGFTKPIDDMGPHNPPTHPELLDYLGQNSQENFDLKQIISIALSEPYALSSALIPPTNAG